MAEDVGSGGPRVPIGVYTPTCEGPLWQKLADVSGDRAGSHIVDLVSLAVKPRPWERTASASG